MGIRWPDHSSKSPTGYRGSGMYCIDLETSGPTRRDPVLYGSVLSEVLQRFWESEEPPTADRRKPEDDECELFYQYNTARCPSGRFVTRLPFLPNRPALGWIKRFVNNCRKPQAERNFTPVLSPAERNAALCSLVRVVQAEHFEEEVSTRTGMVSHYVRLQIVVPEAFILGSGEHHVDMGSVIHLICIVEKSPTPPQYVFWYHNDRMINYDATRGGITVETEPGARTQSRLTVRGATLKDSGNYTCSASNTEPASIHVFVSEGIETEPGARTQSRLTVRGATLKDSGNYTCSASNTEPASIHVFVSEGSEYPTSDNNPM
ncbi:immunoglobulin domain-containing protein [Phthorimaea operculella]|nr:immunoglobulin domain-containing protein [Phthorimaea operculella]